MHSLFLFNSVRRISSNFSNFNFDILAISKVVLRDNVRIPISKGAAAASCEAPAKVKF